MFLITTPNGNVGRHITDALRNREDVRYLVRSERGASAVGAVRGEIVLGDAADPEDVRRALAGVERLYLAHPFGDDQVAVETAFGLAALDAGVRRIVKLGARAFGPGITPDAVTGVHDEIVGRLTEAGVPELTVLRPDRFMQNFLSTAVALAEGSLPDPAGVGARGFVDARDIAEVAVAELLADEPVGGDVELSGPEELTLPAIAERFAAALGRPVRFVDVPLDDAWRARYREAGMSSYTLTGLEDLYRNYLAEPASGLGDGVRRVLGRSPRSIDVFASEVLAPAVNAVAATR
ncbi:Uncharacterized conserved protein YbjT, contains NAD(P)-binding and DUF2867 domains [Streptoalloteichus tenebrarius]|uniref:Uncharacterized conserved protein YbjT, contains NAD(P)-binding and DUF2867 domains n=1 Tax=Streptoalloteichus tenebrarius (strain ATCC 17920 / DSM 40477 / JCM 4838 / CBS 697.72 / NBRC 16177 / NCIMB 11028 / NRRL B-12390 / A12253. 1 / ISP 5477) TaxID=1933 RepID=A0ABT1HPV4_STRSD|nr:NAD(P)H-binding protein [Streptoalloteichus tenebrarius]MCP2257545.1 Uncharacterized conserved protein YbjT, contains NAD(P)-binding and DUF2867 domains [Streptoalloteichus tenebrarius]BFE98496.1 NmrA family NAD(P)-binding protein [Streptoalloteichus tenebrarius]